MAFDSYQTQAKSSDFDGDNTSRGFSDSRWDFRQNDWQAQSTARDTKVPDAFPQNVEFYDSAVDAYRQFYCLLMLRYLQDMMAMYQYLFNGNGDGNRGGEKHPDKEPDKKPDKQPEKQPDKQPDKNDDPPSHIGSIQRGRTIYHDDFSGNRGEHPNSRIFDTAHIGLDGKTRQRGPSIHEDGIISTNNTVMDGNGHLQLFAKREQTYDPVAKENVNYTKGSMHTANGLRINLQDHPNGVVIEVRAKHPTEPGAKFDALWIMTDKWTADKTKGEHQGDTVEYDAAEGGGADITVHYPTKDASGTKDHYGGGAHPKDVRIDDGQFHTYTVVIKPNPKTGRGDVIEYIDGKKEFEKESVFPGDKDLHLKSSLEVSPKWTHKTLKSAGGMDSSAAGVIDYLDVAELK